MKAPLSLATLLLSWALLGCSAFWSEPPAPLAARGRILSQAWGSEPLFVIDAHSGERLGTLAFDGWAGSGHSDGHRAYFVGAHEVTVWDIATGRERARFEHEGERLQPVLAVDERSVFVMETPADGADVERVIALSRDRLAVRWQRQLPLGASWRRGAMAPVVVAGLLLVPAGNRLVAIDTLTGVPRWTFAAPSPLAWPTAAGSTLFALGQDAHVYAIDPEHGSERWRAPLASSAGALADSPWQTRALASAQGLLIAHLGDVLLALDPVSGQRRWTRNGTAAAVIGHDVAFAAGNDGKYVAIDLATGKTRWRLALEHDIGAAPLLADDDALVILRLRSDELYAYDTANGKLLWRFEL